MTDSVIVRMHEHAAHRRGTTRVDPAMINGDRDGYFSASDTSLNFWMRFPVSTSAV